MRSNISSIGSTVRNEKGIVLVSTIALVAILALMGTISVNTTNTEMKISKNYKTSVQAFYAATGGAEYGLSNLRQRLKSVLYPTIGYINGIPDPTMTGYNFDEFSFVKVGGTNTSTIASGNFSGLTSVNQNYNIISKASIAGINAATAKVALSVEDNLIPLFQFAVFYNDDLEIHPGPDMIFSGGRIHSNKDIYLGANNTLSINSKTTTAGNVIYQRKTTGAEQNVNGIVQFKDAGGNYQAVKISGIVLDSNNPNWAVESINRWNGNLKSTEHGIFELNLVPLPETSSPIEIIKPGETLDPATSTEPEALKQARYYWKAGLRIIDGVAYGINGNVLDLTNGGTETNPITTETFYEAREGYNITVATVNVGILNTNTVATNAIYSAPEPGVLYVSQTGSNKGVRLKNGATLPAGGLTVASVNPVYIQGNYNLANVPAAVAADAVTILSNSWSDPNSSLNLNTNRVASNTTVKAAIMTGHIASAGSQYSGGLENFPRFLEKWSSKTFTYSGSLVSLWQSEQATGNWQYGAPVYKAPIRDWSYGIDIGNMPPGTPFVRLVQKVGWYQDIN
ncbi:MAG: PilX N-terminal domain-containing pilus assembly protein [Candidatus Scalinduaceae bacterium]